MAGAPHPKPAARKKARPRPLPSKSPKRHLETEEREHVRLAVINRDGGCVGPRHGLPGPCRSPWGHRPQLECHEVKTRGRGGSHLRTANAVALCQDHHDLTTREPELAHACGLMRHSWEPEPDMNAPWSGATHVEEN